MSIGKRLIIIFLSSFFGITAVPDVLVSADHAPITDVKFAQVEATISDTAQVAATAINTTQNTATTKTSTNKPAQATPKANNNTVPTQGLTQAPVQKPAQAPAQTPTVTPTSATAPVSKPDQINIAGNTISIVKGIKDTKIDAGNHANLYWNNRFIYGHRTAHVFGGLKNLGIGSTFTMTVNNVTSTYRISNRIIYDYEATADGNGALRLNGDTTSNYYLKTVKGKDNNDTLYDLVLMTCHGASLGGGNAAQRLVLFANKI